VASGAIDTAASLYALAFEPGLRGVAAGTLAVALVQLLVFGALLQAGIRRWVRRQPPDPPAG